MEGVGELYERGVVRKSGMDGKGMADAEKAEFYTEAGSTIWFSSSGSLIVFTVTSICTPRDPVF